MNDAIPLVEVSGGAYAMGYQYGAQTRDLVRKRLALLESKANVSPGGLRREAMHTISPVRDASPALVQELRGLADGAGISLAEALLCQMKAPGGQATGTGGTTFVIGSACTASSAPLAGLSLDLAPELEDLMLVLHLSPTDGRPRALILGLAGQLGNVGINEYGLATVAINPSSGAPRLALPMTILLRLMLEKRSVAECVRLAERRYSASAAAVFICDGQGRVTDLEIRPDGVVQREVRSSDLLVHGSNYVSPDGAPDDAEYPLNSFERARRLRTLLLPSVGSATITSLQRAIADDSIRIGMEEKRAPASGSLRGECGAQAAAGLIVEPAACRLHVQRGRSQRDTWHSYTA